MRVAGAESFGRLLSRAVGEGGRREVDAADRRAIYTDTVLRLQADDGVFGAVGLCGQSQTYQAPDGETRTGGNLPEAELVKAGEAASEVSVSVERSRDK